MMTKASNGIKWPWYLSLGQLATLSALGDIIAMVAMDRFLKWMQELKHRKGKLTGTISLWMQGEESQTSYTLVLTTDGITVKEPGLRSADLVLSMQPAFFDAWMSGSLEPEAISSGGLAWDGDIQLFRELGFRMSNAPMTPHQSLLRQLHSEES